MSLYTEITFGNTYVDLHGEKMLVLAFTFRRSYTPTMGKNDNQHYEDLQPTTSQPPVYIDLNEILGKNEEQHVYENKTATEPRGRTAYLKSENPA